MCKHIIIINGKGGSGKDTCIEFVSKEYPSKVINISTIDCIKEIARFCGWSGAKENRDRKFLSDLKQLVSDYSDIPHTSTMNLAETFIKYSPYEIMFIHCREPENISRLFQDICKMCEKYGDCICNTLLIKRPSIDSENLGNASDDDVENYSYDYVFNNSFESLSDYRNVFMKFFDSSILSK